MNDMQIEEAIEDYNEDERDEMMEDLHVRELNSQTPRL